MTARRYEIDGWRLQAGRVVVVLFALALVLVAPLIVVGVLAWRGWRWLITPEQPGWDK